MLSQDHYSCFILIPLHVAAKNSHRQIIDELLSLGAPLDDQASNGETALHFGAMNGHMSVVQTLLCAGANGSLPMDYPEYRGVENVASLPLPHSISANSRNHFRSN
jgi:ankyrin repeat protein